MKYENYSTIDFIDECINEYVSDYDMYMYLKHITNSFDKDLFEKFYEDFNFICGSKVKFIVPVKRKSEYFEGETTVYSYENEMTLNMFYMKENHEKLIEKINNQQYDNSINIDDITQYKKKQIDLLNTFTYLFISQLDLNGKIDLIEKTEGFDLDFKSTRKKYSGLIRFSELVEKEHEKIKKNTSIPEPPPNNEETQFDVNTLSILHGKYNGKLWHEVDINEFYNNFKKTPAKTLKIKCKHAFGYLLSKYEEDRNEIVDINKWMKDHFDIANYSKCKIKPEYTNRKGKNFTFFELIEKNEQK